MLLDGRTFEGVTHFAGQSVQLTRAKTETIRDEAGIEPRSIKRMAKNLTPGHLAGAWK